MWIVSLEIDSYWQYYCCFQCDDQFVDDIGYGMDVDYVNCLLCCFVCVKFC